MVARVLYDKGYNEYVAAAKAIGAERPDAEFLLLGNISENHPSHVPKSIVEKDCNAGYIDYLGCVSDVLPVLKQVDCIVLPSYHEGMSRSLMEALAMGKPIITTDIPGCRETVDDGINGFLVEPKNAESLTATIRKFLSLTYEERIKMGKCSREKAEQQFDVKKVVEVYKKITSPWLKK